MRFKPSPYLLLVFIMLIWAGNFVLGRAMHDDIPPMALTFWRWLAATAVMAPFAGRRAWQQRALIRRHWRLVTVLAACGVAIYHALTYTALSLTTATNVALIFAVSPVIIPIAAFVLDRERASRRQAAGIALSLAGVVAIITQADPQVVAGFGFNLGDLLVLLAVCTWAIYAVLIIRRPPAMATTTLVFVLSAIATLMVAPLYAWELAVKGGFAISLANVATIGYVSIFASAIAVSVWNHATFAVGATRAGLFTHLTPVFSVILAVLLLDESLHLYHVAGTAFIVMGLYLMVRSPRQRPPHPALSPLRGERDAEALARPKAEP